MKIREVSANARKSDFLIATRSGDEFSFPYSKAAPKPSANNPVEKVFVTKELGNEGSTYILRSRKEGSIRIEQVLEYHEDPEYLADLLTYKRSVVAQTRVETSELSRRQLATQLDTSVPQLYRLLDPGNTSKSMKQLITLLHILDCNVDVVLQKRKPKSLQRTVVTRRRTEETDSQE